MKTAGSSFRISRHAPHLFVYGTLRFEYPNPLAVKLKAIFICKGSAPGVLYDLGWYPGAVFNDDVRTRVIGEVIALGNAERRGDP